MNSWFRKVKSSQESVYPVEYLDAKNNRNSEGQLQLLILGCPSPVDLEILIKDKKESNYVVL